MFPPLRRLLSPARWAVPLTALALLTACGSDASDAWKTAELTRGDLVVNIVAVGTLEPLNSVEVGPTVSGRLVAVEVEQNDRVVAGQLLARIDPTPFSLAVDQARASVSAAQASRNQVRVTAREAERARDRTERLRARGAASDVELLDAQAALETATASVRNADAQVAQARASLLTAQDNLSQTEVLSPIDGVVLQRTAELGQTVVSNMTATTLFTIASDLAAMKADVEVDEADVGRVEAGQPATFTVSAFPESSFHATVAQVDLAPDPSEAVVVYLAELRLDNSEGQLRPGMTATASIETARVSDTLLAPAAALRFNPSGVTPPDKAHVWVLQDQRPVAVEVVNLGTDGQTVALSSASLDVGVTVLTGGGPTRRRPLGPR